jgi:CRP/FNR family transcriptional regulator
MAVLAGVVRVFTWSSRGRHITLRYAYPGDLLGLAPLLTGSHISEAEGVTDATLALLSLDLLQRQATESPPFCWGLTEEMARQALEFVESFAVTAFEPVTVRVARHLRAAALQTPSRDTIAHLTHQRLADAVGTSREVVTRILGDLRDQKVIDTDNGRLRVLDGQRLARIAAAGSEPVDRAPPGDL